MDDNKKYEADDLVLVVWPRQSEPDVNAGKISWEDAARSAWAMDATKAQRVSIVVAVFNDLVVGAWRATALAPDINVPAGKTRNVSRSSFTTETDPRLAYLVGTASPWPRRRNPQMTIELRDLPGAETVIGDVAPPASGIVQIGEYVLSVADDGTAVIRMPAGAHLTVSAVASN